MPTGRHSSGAVHIPAIGDLVIGGYSGDHLRTVELLQAAGEVGDSNRVWKNISCTIKPRWEPSAVYFNENVIVVSMWDNTVEILSLAGGQIGQWTLLSECHTPSNRTSSICAYDGRIFISSKLQAEV